MLIGTGESKRLLILKITIMSLDSFFNNLHYSSSATIPPEFTENSRSLTSDEYSIGDYEPLHISPVNLDNVLNVMKKCEAESALREDYETAAGLRDRIKNVADNKELFLKLFDLKIQAIKDGDYKFASKLQKRIQDLLSKKRKPTISSEKEIL